MNSIDRPLDGRKKSVRESDCAGADLTRACSRRSRLSCRRLARASRLTSSLLKLASESGGGTRVSLAFLTVVPLLLLTGCSEHPADVDTGFNLVEDFRVVDMVPPSASASGFTEVRLRGTSRCAGRAWLGFSGRCGGSSVGMLHLPVEGIVGSQGTQIELPAGPFEVLMEVELACDLRSCAIGVEVACDSLYAEGTLVGWNSTEGAALYRDDIPANTAFIVNRTWTDVILDCPGQ